jgi:hypothetical protein
MNILFSERYRYFIYRQACDMRKGYDGLSGLVLNEFKMSPLSGDVFVFISTGRATKSKSCTGRAMALLFIQNDWRKEPSRFQN